MNVTATSSQFRMSLAAVCVIFAAGSSSAIAAGWTTPAILGAPDASWVATAGADNKGNAVAAWLQTDTSPYKVYASLRKAARTDGGESAHRSSSGRIGAPRASRAVSSASRGPKPESTSESAPTSAVGDVPAYWVASVRRDSGP